MDTIIHQFCTEQRDLLQLELLQEQHESSSSEQPQQNNVLHGLHVHDVSVGLYGRTIVQLKLPAVAAHKFTTGDEVEIQSRRSNQSTAGVIHQVTEESISVALFRAKAGAGTVNNNKITKNDEEEEEDDEDDFVGTPPLSLLPKSSIEVHKKLLWALEELEQQGVDHPVAGTVIQTVFGSASSESLVNTATSITAPLPQSTLLDDSQTEAIQMALQQPTYLIHGPPGSGKTTTIVELIRHAVQLHKYRVLVTAPSNVAVDNILSRLVAIPANSNKKQQRLQVVRLGHPARLQADILPYSLEALVQASEGTEIVHDVRHELRTWLRKMNHPRTSFTDKMTARREIKLLRQEIKQREQKVVADLLQRAQVVLATCVGAANRLLNNFQFDLVVIDEAAQALEAACWIPILRGSRLVLAGDHCQLPPTIKCNDPRVQEGLGRTMFARIMKLYEDNPRQISRMLKVQYRMHETIANWASEALYQGELTTHASAQGRTLATLSGVSSQEDDDDLTHVPLLLIDTAGCDCNESTNAAGSRFNPGEALLVQQHVQKLLDMGVPASQIAIITPYNGQVDVLKSMGMPVEIRTVDGFQGGEREAVVLSLVRSSPGASIGFLRDDRRLNVAVTRAKRHCCVVADSETVSASPFVKNLLDWIEQHGEQRSALDYMTDDTLAQLGQDLIQAQLELQRNDTGKETGNKKTKNAYAGVAAKKMAPSREREALLERVRMFHQTGKPSDELVFSTELSKGDRHAIHELAEELGILHISSGTEGMDRRMTLSIPFPEPNVNGVQLDIENDNSSMDIAGTIDEAESNEVDVPQIPAFHVLHDQDDSSASSDEKPNANSGNLPERNNVVVTGTRTSKKKKKKKPNVGDSSSSPNEDGKDDDMAFLDAEIHKVQNSHGRTVIGKGQNYRTIVNGILLARPTPPPKKVDPRATTALQAKLKQAESSRKAKAKPKKEVTIK